MGFSHHSQHGSTQGEPWGWAGSPKHTSETGRRASSSDSAQATLRAAGQGRWGSGPRQLHIPDNSRQLSPNPEWRMHTLTEVSNTSFDPSVPTVGRNNGTGMGALVQYLGGFLETNQLDFLTRF
jgi:hypothetical protein